MKRCITKNKLQTIGELHNSPARPKSLVPLCRRTPSTDIGHWWDQERQRNGRLVASLEDCGEFYPLRAAVVPREEVCILIIHSLSNKYYFLFTLSNFHRIYPPAKDDLCVAVGTNGEHLTQSIFLQPILQNCDKCYRCYVEALDIQCPVSSFIEPWSFSSTY